MKLIFFDIDGTLIDGKRQMPQSAVRAITRARENGHLCLVNTGRTASIVLDWLPKLVEFDGYLCGCGTQILFRGEELLHKTFSVEESLNILEGLEENKIDAILEGVENDYHNDLDRMHTVTFRNYILEHYRDRNWESYREAPGKYDKFYCFADDSASVYRFMESRADFLDLIDRGEGFFEVVPKGYSKATCMDRLLEALQRDGSFGPVSIEDTVAIGDSANDIPMLEHAGIAIAMGNSVPSVIEMADHVTTDVRENGIEKALDWLGVLKFSDK